jgi:probable phosphoglycerate mutase
VLPSRARLASGEAVTPGAGAADRIAALARSARSLAAHSGEHGNGGPIAKAKDLSPRRQGLLECDFGDWTGSELKKLMKLPEWNTVLRARRRSASRW